MQITEYKVPSYNRYHNPFWGQTARYRNLQRNILKPLAGELWRCAHNLTLLSNADTITLRMLGLNMLTWCMRERGNCRLQYVYDNALSRVEHGLIPRSIKRRLSADMRALYAVAAYKASSAAHLNYVIDFNESTQIRAAIVGQMLLLKLSNSPHKRDTTTYSTRYRADAVWEHTNAGFQLRTIKLFGTLLQLEVTNGDGK